MVAELTLPCTLHIVEGLRSASRRVRLRQQSRLLHVGLQDRLYLWAVASLHLVAISLGVQSLNAVCTARPDPGVLHAPQQQQRFLQQQPATSQRDSSPNFSCPLTPPRTRHAEAPQHQVCTEAAGGPAKLPAFGVDVPMLFPCDL